MARYFVLEGKALEAVQQWRAKGKAAHEELRQLTADLKPDRIDGGYGGRTLHFSDTPHPDCKYLKGRQGYVPKDQTLRRKIDQVQIPDGVTLAQALKIDFIFPDMTLSTPGLAQFDIGPDTSVLVAIVRDGIEIEGCRRISDLEFEELEKEQERNAEFRNNPSTFVDLKANRTGPGC